MNRDLRLQRNGSLALIKRIRCARCKRWAPLARAKSEGWGLCRCPECKAKENQGGRTTYVDVSAEVTVRMDRGYGLVVMA